MLCSRERRRPFPPRRPNRTLIDWKSVNAHRLAKRFTCARMCMSAAYCGMISLQHRMALTKGKHTHTHTTTTKWICIFAHKTHACTSCNWVQGTLCSRLGGCIGIDVANVTVLRGFCLGGDGGVGGIRRRLPPQAVRISISQCIFAETFTHTYAHTRNELITGRGAHTKP